MAEEHEERRAMLAPARRDLVGWAAEHAAEILNDPDSDQPVSGFPMKIAVVIEYGTNIPGSERDVIVISSDVDPEKPEALWAWETDGLLHYALDDR